MPAPLERLYELTPRDQSGVLWSPHFGAITTAANNISVVSPVAAFTNSAPPRGKILFITHLVLTMKAGGVLTAFSVEAVVLDIGGNPLSRVGMLETNTVGPDRAAVNIPIDFAMIMGDHTLQIQGSFSAATSSNEITLNWAGYSIPRGNAGAF